jgi:hypothetical protein
MPKSLSKTPAPKKDRIYGSDKNKVGSASSKASAKGIELSESILGTLSQKAKDYNESHPKNKVSVATLKAVMRRGMGAYSTSHRPTITGGAPNSRQAWGFARVNKFLKKKAGQQVKAAYVQDNDLMEKGGSVGQEITCVNCGWHWNTSDSEESDKYICHKCGFDNRTFYDHEPIGEFNKYKIYKSIKPIRQANEIIERLDYMENQNKMAQGGVTEFYKQYQDWYKNGVSDKMTIMVSVPNAFSKMSSEDNHVILDVFEKRDESVDGKEKLKELLELADKNGIDVYLEPIPRHNKIKDEAKKQKITRKYLISYYEKFGFELLPNGFMVRKHGNNKMEYGGQVPDEIKENPIYKLLVQKSKETYFTDNKVKMPSINKIGEFLESIGITTNGDYKFGNLKIGRNEVVRENGYKEVFYDININSNKSYYSRNTPSYANQIIDYIDNFYKNNKMEKGGYYKAGGEINPDDKNVKDYFSHGSGNVGGVLVGKRHSEGGIKAVNKSTNQPLEMEGGEVVITRNAVSDDTKREFEGKMMTNREILSKINESGGGVSFADGGDIPESIYTSGKEYKYGGKMMKDHEIVSSCGCKHSMAEGGRLNIGTIKKTDSDVIFDKQSGAFYLNVIDGAGNRTNKLNVNTIDDIFEKYPSFKLNKLGEKEFEDYMAEGGETDYQTELKNHLFPKIEVEVEIEVEPIMEEMPVNEHYITADDLGLSDGMPMLAVGTIVYSSGGNDQWEVVSFSDDGVNLVNKPKSPLQSKMEDKHLTFDELIKYFKDKAISIKNISTERELEPAIALVRHKIPQKSYAMGGFIDGDEDEDARIMQSQFGKSNFK